MDNGYSETFATYEFADKGTYVCMYAMRWRK